MAENFDKLVSDFSKLKVEANNDGLIPTSNVLIIQFPSIFFNTFSIKLLESILNSYDSCEDPKICENLHGYAEGLLENAAAECGYHTGCGVINSDEFASVMGSSIKNPEDILYGLFAIAVSWGWGDLEIVELIPHEKMVLRAYDYYESDIKESLKHKHCFAYMLRGVARAFMDLIYGEKCSSSPKRLGAFKCEQTKGIELGDEYGEFVVTKE